MTKIKNIYMLLISLFFILSTITPINAHSDDIIPLDKLDLKSQSYILFDRDTKTILAEKDSQNKVHPASITKVLTVITALDIMEPVDLNQKITVHEKVYDGLNPIASLAGFEINEEITLLDVLQGIMLPSGADATRTLSYYLFEDSEKLSKAMNKKAKEIGMNDSNFVNTSGLDHDEQLSTAHDLMILVDYALENEIFRDLYESSQYITSKTKQHPDGIELVDQNLIAAERMTPNYIKGAKSGYTQLAQRSLSSIGEHNNKELIFISLNNNTDNGIENGPVTEANLVYDRAFKQFKSITIINKQTIIDTLPIENGPDFEYEFNENIQVFVPDVLTKNDLIVEIKDKPTNLTAPIKEGSSMGILEISYNDKIIHRETIRNKERIPVSLSKVLIDFFKAFSSIIALSIFFVLIFLVIMKSIIKHRTK